MKEKGRDPCLPINYTTWQLNSLTFNYLKRQNNLATNNYFCIYFRPFPGNRKRRQWAILPQSDYHFGGQRRCNVMHCMSDYVPNYAQAPSAFCDLREKQSVRQPCKFLKGVPEHFLYARCLQIELDPNLLNKRKQITQHGWRKWRKLISACVILNITKRNWRKRNRKLKTKILSSGCDIFAFRFRIILCSLASQLCMESLGHSVELPEFKKCDHNRPKYNQKYTMRTL